MKYFGLLHPLVVEQYGSAVDTYTAVTLVTIVTVVAVVT